jgi:hypothetical protein
LFADFMPALALIHGQFTGTFMDFFPLGRTGLLGGFGGSLFHRITPQPT